MCVDWNGYVIVSETVKEGSFHTSIIKVLYRSNQHHQVMGFGIHKKLGIWFVFVSLLSLGLAPSIGVHSIDTIVMDQAQDKVKSDLNTAN